MTDTLDLEELKRLVPPSASPWDDPLAWDRYESAVLTAFPALIAEAERLRARNAMLEDALDQAHSERSEDHWP